MSLLELQQDVEQGITRFRFGRHDRILIDDVAYAPAESGTEGHVLRRVDSLSMCESFTHEEIWNLHSQGRLTCDRRYFSAGKAMLRAEFGSERLMYLSDKEKEKVEWREFFCKRFLEMVEAGEASKSDRSMNRAIAKLHGEATALETMRQNSGRCGQRTENRNPPKPSTLRNWLRDYQKGAYEPEALRDLYCRSGNKTPRFEQEEENYLQEYAQRYLDRRKPSKTKIYHDLKSEIKSENKKREQLGLRLLAVPGKKALFRRIDALDPFVVCTAREGADAAHRKFRPTHRGLGVIRPLERIEMDEHKLDLQVLTRNSDFDACLDESLKEEIRAGRVWMTTAIDCATKCCLGLILSAAPGASFAIATLNMAVNDKTDLATKAGCLTPWDMFGTPESVYTDGGSAFISSSFGGAVRDLEAEGSCGIVGQPQSRGTVERSYRRVHEDLISRFDGRTFKDIVEKGDYDAEAHAVLYVAELERVLIRYIVDVYHNTPHNGLGGETPRNAWTRRVAKYGVQPPPTSDENRHIFGTTLLRKISKEGIRLFGLRYQSTQLQKLLREAKANSVTVRFNPQDLGSISVSFERESWINVPCLHQDVDGVALSTWRSVAQRLHRQYQNEAAIVEPIVLQALRDIQEASDSATARAGLTPPVLSEADAERLDREIFRNMDCGREDEEGAPPVPGLDEEYEGVELEELDAANEMPPSRAEYKTLYSPFAALEGDDDDDIVMED